MHEWSPKNTEQSAASSSAREFQAGNGKVIYCPDCRRIAVDFAGYYLLFHRCGYDNFLACLQEIKKDFEGPEAGDDVHVGPEGSIESIRLQPGQIKEMALLMEMAVLIMDMECPGHNRLG